MSGSSLVWLQLFSGLIIVIVVGLSRLQSMPPTTETNKLKYKRVRGGELENC